MLVTDKREKKMTDQTIIKKEIERLALLHKEAESQLNALSKEATPDRLFMQRVKKQKLELKDRIQNLKDKLLPDIIA